YTEEEVHAIWQSLQAEIARRVSQMVVSEITYTKEVIDSKDESVYQDSTYYADIVALTAEEKAIEHADQKHRESETYTNQVRDALLQDIANRAELEYVDGKLLLKADASYVQTINETVTTLSGISDSLLSRVSDNEVLLQEHGGSITSVTQEIDTVKGTLSLTIDQLSTLDGTVQNQQVQINANAESLSLKAEQSQVNQIAGDVSTVSNQVSQMTIDVNGISNTVSSLRADFDGLSIGGRNLLEGDWNLTWADSHNSYQYLLRPQIQSILPKVKVGDVVTFSFDVEAESDTSLRIYDSNGHPGISFGSYTLNIIQGKQRVTFTKTLVTGSSSSSTWYMDVYNNNNGVKFSISNLKIERGNKATDWTPAPEDVDYAISSVQQYASSIDQKADSISSTVTNLSQTVSGHTSSISNINSSITQMSGQINAKAEQTQVDTIAGQVSSVSNQVSQLTIDVGGISTSVSAVRADFDGLQIGGRNLRRGSTNVAYYFHLSNLTGTKTLINDESVPSKYVGVFDITGGGNGIIYTSLKQIQEINEMEQEYTVSFFMKADRELTLNPISINQATITKRETPNNITTTYRKYSVSFKITTLDGLNHNFHLPVGVNDKPFKVYIHSFKVEKGNKATD
ncbi:hypothetical protein ACWE42_25200, partial [Sutcliffiella cohnii]